MTSTCNYPSFSYHIQEDMKYGLPYKLVTTLHFHVTYKIIGLLTFNYYLVTTLHFHVTYKV